MSVDWQEDKSKRLRLFSLTASTCHGATLMHLIRDTPHVLVG